MGEPSEKAMEAAQACFDRMPRAKDAALVDAEEVIAARNGWQLLRVAIARAIDAAIADTKRECARKAAALDEDAYCNGAGIYDGDVETWMRLFNEG